VGTYYGQKTYAIMRGDTVYSLKPVAGWDTFSKKQGWRWRGYINGEPWRFFTTKAEFEQHVDFDFYDTQEGPYGRATRKARDESEGRGQRILDALSELKGKPRG
jgi:hypothetical protein